MEKLGRYEIREIVGEGAMARVYKAYDPEIDRTLAIKLLKSQLAEDDQYRLRFLREARAAGVLSHPWGRDAAWSFVTREWSTLTKRLGVFMGLPNIVGATGNFCSAAAATNVKQFFAAHPVPSAERCPPGALPGSPCWGWSRSGTCSKHSVPPTAGAGC